MFTIQYETKLSTETERTVKQLSDLTGNNASQFHNFSKMQFLYQKTWFFGIQTLAFY
jgi:hypothetical protein